MLNSKIFIFDILVHITFLFTILFLFFFLVGLKKEREALISNIQSNTEKILRNNQQIQNNQQVRNNNLIDKNNMMSTSFIQPGLFREKSNITNRNQIIKTD